MFTTNDHAYVLSIKQGWRDKINLEWFMLEHQGLFHKLVTSVSDNATFNKEYAEKQIISIPHIDYQNGLVNKLRLVKETKQKLEMIKNKTDSLLECVIT